MLQTQSSDLPHSLSPSFGMDPRISTLLTTLPASSSQHTIKLPVVVIPSGARDGSLVTADWLCLPPKGDGLVLCVDANELLDEKGKDRVWRDVVRRNLQAGGEFCKNALTVLLVNYKTNCASSRVDDKVTSTDLWGRKFMQKRNWKGFEAAGKDVSKISVIDTLTEHTTMLQQLPATWVLIVLRAKIKANKLSRPVFIQLDEENDVVDSDDGSDIADDDARLSVAGSVPGDGAAPAGMALSIAQVHGRGLLPGARRRFVEFYTEEGIHRVRNGESRPSIEPVLLSKSAFFKEGLRADLITRPSLDQTAMLHTKAKAVVRIHFVPPQAAASSVVGNAAALPAAPVSVPDRVTNAGNEDSVGYGTGFLVSPKFMVSCFHNFYHAVEDPQTRSISWEPWAQSFNCCLPLIDVRFTVDLADIKYSPLSAPQNTSHNIWYDMVVIQLPDNVTTQLQPVAAGANVVGGMVAPLLLPINYIRLWESAATRAEFLNPEDQKTYLQQALFIIGFPGAMQPASSADAPVLSITSRDNHIKMFWHWEMAYSNPTWGGQSGAPGLLADGRLACMHRRTGPPLRIKQTLDAAGKPVESIYGRQGATVCNYGLRVDLVMLDDFGVGAALPMHPSKTSSEMKQIKQELLSQYTQWDNAVAVGLPAQVPAPSPTASIVQGLANPVAAAPCSQTMQNIINAVLQDKSARAYVIQELRMRAN